MPDIYTQHTAAFRQVSAFVILHKGSHVGRLAFKFPRDGAGRLYCYLHYSGEKMVRGMAGGYGYDKRSAAAAEAARKLPPASPEAETYAAFTAALRDDNGYDWRRRLESAGFTVLQAV